MKQYRTMAKVHCVGSHAVPPAQMSYKQSLCGLEFYCQESSERPSEYCDHYGMVPLVGWRKPHLITCKSCQKAMRK